MNTVFSKLLLMCLVALNLATHAVTNVDEIDKPILATVYEKDNAPQELLDAIESTLPLDTARYYKYFADTRVPKGYKYRLNADYIETKDSGTSTIKEYNAQIKPFNWKNSSVGTKSSTINHQVNIYHEKRILCNRFDKLREKVLLDTKVKGFLSLFPLAFFNLLQFNASLDDPALGKSLLPGSTIVSCLAISSMILYYIKYNFYKNNVQELDYLQRREKSDQVTYFECDDIEREFNNPISGLKVATAILLSIIAGVAVNS